MTNPNAGSSCDAVRRPDGGSFGIKGSKYRGKMIWKGLR